MDVFDQRQKKLRELIETRFDNRQTDFADRAGIAENYVSRMLSTGANRKKIGEQLARRIEKLCRLPSRWLDGEPVETPPEWDILRESGWPFSFEAARFNRLTLQQRSQIDGVVRALVEQFEKEAPQAKKRMRVAARQ